MIRFAEEKDRNAIVRLWHDVFGDSVEGINIYLDKYLDCVLIYIVEEKVVGMLSLLPLKCNGIDGKYVYAVATDKEFRGRTIASDLIRYCENENFLLLVPAEKSLFEYYAKLGFKPICNVEKQQFLSDELKDVSGEIERITADEFFTLRRDAFGEFDFFQWQPKELQTISDMYNGHIYKGSDFFAVCDVYENEVIIKELYSKDVFNAVCALNARLKKEKYTAIIKKDNGSPLAMIKGTEPKNPYFNLAMD